MKEARIVMPLAPNLPYSDDVHRTMRGQLVAAFGGYTKTFGHGGWLDGENKLIEEGVCVYDVAMEGTGADNKRLRDIALRTARALNQQAVYIRYNDGSVEIRNTGLGALAGFTA